MWKLAAKGAISALLIWYVMRNLDVGDIVRQLGHASYITLISSVVSLVVLQLAAAWRWAIILRALGYFLGLGKMMALVLVGQFFSQVLPSSVGGDAVRIWEIHRVGVPTKVAVSSVLLDRGIGLIGLVLLVAIMQPVSSTLTGDPTLHNGINLLIGLSCLGVIGGLILEKVLQPWTRFRPLRAIAGLAHDFRIVVFKPRAIAATMILSIIYQAGAVAVVYILAKGLGIPISFLACLALIPLTNFVTLMPISIAGWGVREAAFIFLLGLVGIGASQALALSILFGLTTLVASVSGAVVWLLWPARQIPASNPPLVVETSNGATET
jgi:uncharacterized protein (TIRG00374 family)